MRTQVASSDQDPGLWYGPLSDSPFAISALPWLVVAVFVLSAIMLIHRGRRHATALPLLRLLLASSLVCLGVAASDWNFSLYLPLSLWALFIVGADALTLFELQKRRPSSEESALLQGGGGWLGVPYGLFVLLFLADSLDHL